MHEVGGVEPEVTRLADYLEEAWRQGYTTLSIAMWIHECIPDSEAAITKSTTEMLVDELEAKHAVR